MGFVTAYKKDSVVHILTDSLVCGPNLKSSNPLTSQISIFRPKDDSLAIVGIAGNPRDISYLRYMDTLFSSYNDDYPEFTLGYVINVVVPLIRKECEKYGFYEKDGYYSFDFSLILAKGNKAFVITDNKLTFEIGDHYSIGQNGDAIDASLDFTKEPFEALVKAALESRDNAVYIGYPLIYGNTANENFELLDEDKCIQIVEGGIK